MNTPVLWINVAGLWNGNQLNTFQVCLCMCVMYTVKATVTSLMCVVHLTDVNIWTSLETRPLILTSGRCTRMRRISNHNSHLQYSETT